MAGLIAGTQAGVVIAAGGANFPDRMPWDGGRKIYYDEIFVLAPGESAWRPAGRLPERRAYAAAVSTPDGVLVAGGENADTVFGDTLWLRWNGRTVDVQRGPPLPAPRTSSVAAIVEGRVLVAGGYAPGTVRPSCRDFWQLDLAGRAAGWKPLASWPGPSRAQAVAATLDGAFYLISGLEMTVDAAGQAQPAYLNDAYRYFRDKWERLPDLPWSAVAAPSPAPVTSTPARVWVLGGVDGRLVGKVPRDTRVPDHVVCFEVARQAWVIAPERWPDPVVTAPTVAVGPDWWIVSGEIMAGVRTTSVNSWRSGDAR